VLRLLSLSLRLRIELVRRFFISLFFYIFVYSTVTIPYVLEFVLISFSENLSVNYVPFILGHFYLLVEEPGQNYIKLRGLLLLLLYHSVCIDIRRLPLWRGFADQFICCLQGPLYRVITTDSEGNQTATVSSGGLTNVQVRPVLCSVPDTIRVFLLCDRLLIFCLLINVRNFTLLMLYRRRYTVDPKAKPRLLFSSVVDRHLGPVPTFHFGADPDSYPLPCFTHFYKI
jgi:hypothetical protein